MKRTPWFYFLEHRPVREGVYEGRCAIGRFNAVRVKWVKRKIGQSRWIMRNADGSTGALFSDCSACQWRGIYKDEQ